MPPVVLDVNVAAFGEKQFDKVQVAILKNRGKQCRSTGLEKIRGLGR